MTDKQRAINNSRRLLGKLAFLAIVSGITFAITANFMFMISSLFGVLPAVLIIVFVVSLISTIASASYGIMVNRARDKVMESDQKIIDILKKCDAKRLESLSAFDPQVFDKTNSVKEGREVVENFLNYLTEKDILPEYKSIGQNTKQLFRNIMNAFYQIPEEYRSKETFDTLVDLYKDLNKQMKQRDILMTIKDILEKANKVDEDIAAARELFNNCDASALQDFGILLPKEGKGANLIYSLTDRQRQGILKAAEQVPYTYIRDRKVGETVKEIVPLELGKYIGEAMGYIKDKYEVNENVKNNIIQMFKGTRDDKVAKKLTDKIRYLCENSMKNKLIHFVEVIAKLSTDPGMAKEELIDYAFNKIVYDNVRIKIPGISFCNQIIHPSLPDKERLRRLQKIQKSFYKLEALFTYFINQPIDIDELIEILDKHDKITKEICEKVRAKFNRLKDYDKYIYQIIAALAKYNDPKSAIEKVTVGDNIEEALKQL